MTVLKCRQAPVPAILYLMTLGLLCGLAGTQPDQCSAGFDKTRFLPKSGCNDRGQPDESTLQQCAALKSVCGPGCSMHQSLLTNSTTGHWGYFYEGLAPALVVQSGDTIDMELATMVGFFADDLMVEGDPGMEAITRRTADGKPAFETVGAFGGGEGGHFLAGPVFVCGAQPGDVLQVDVLDLQPRPNPGRGNRTWGATWSGAIGWQAKSSVGWTADRGYHEGVVIYEIMKDAESGTALYAEPQYEYIWDDLGITSPCAPLKGEYPRTTKAGAASWANEEGLFGGTHIPCIDGKQTWKHWGYAGHEFDVPESKRDYSFEGKFRSDIGLHIGNMGTTPKVGYPVNSNAPTRTGGNIDDRRLTSGSTLYLPVETEGALLMAGDGHAAMGDAELSGTGIEVSLNSKLRLTLHKAGSLPLPLQHLEYPLLETADAWVIEGLQYPDYLRELDDPQVKVFEDSDLTRAMTVTVNHTRDFLMHVYGLTENQAFSAMGVGIDFGISQVVDGNAGLHAIIPKKLFPEQSEPGCASSR